MSREEWLKEYTAFVQAKEAPVPSGMLDSLKRRLFPSPKIVFSKVAVIHIVVGFLSLAICNQFGLNPFQTDRSLADWFMTVGGHQFCMVACGVLFMASTYLFANFVLSLEEFETIRRYEWLQASIAGLVSLAAFYFFGAELVFAFAALWLFGGILGAFVSIEASYRLRRAIS